MTLLDMCDDDNIYINEVIARQIAEDAIDLRNESLRKIRSSWIGKGWKCKCGSDRFDVDENHIMCFRCGHIYTLEGGK
jgi:hypothetical protein